jgi:hypothetical protein
VSGSLLDLSLDLGSRRASGRVLLRRLGARRRSILVVRVTCRVLALGDVGDLPERISGLVTHDLPASTSELADAAEILLVVILELFCVPHVGAVDHEGVRGTGDVLFVANAIVSRAAAVVVVEYDIEGWAVLDDLLEVRMEVLDCVDATVGSLRSTAGTSARVGSRGHLAGCLC